MGFWRTWPCFWPWCRKVKKDHPWYLCWDSSLQKYLPNIHKDWGNYFILTNFFFQYHGLNWTIQSLEQCVLYKGYPTHTFLINEIISPEQRGKWLQDNLQSKKAWRSTESRLPPPCGDHVPQACYVGAHRFRLQLWQLWPRFYPFCTYLCPWLF